MLHGVFLTHCFRTMVPTTLGMKGLFWFRLDIWFTIQERCNSKRKATVVTGAWCDRVMLETQSETEMAVHGPLTFFPFIQSSSSEYGMVPPTLSTGISSSLTREACSWLCVGDSSQIGNDDSPFQSFIILQSTGIS